MSLNPPQHIRPGQFDKWQRRARHRAEVWRFVFVAIAVAAVVIAFIVG